MPADGRGLERHWGPCGPRACAQGPRFHQSPLPSPRCVDEAERKKNRTKSKVWARVEHAIGVIKRVFGFAKVRYRGLKKNTHRLLVTCALADLFMARHHLLRCQRA
jgi:transposase, IS5 family